jgi:hypothetical protein
MNQNTAGAVLLVILAAAGFVQHVPAAWALAALAAALAFLKAEADRGDVLFDGLHWRRAAAVCALGSWFAVALAVLSLA